jgi:hypothetical protein
MSDERSRTTRVTRYLSFRGLEDEPTGPEDTDRWWENDDVEDSVLEYTLQAAIRSSDRATASLDSLVAKGTNQLSVSVAAFVASVGATGVSVSASSQSWVHYMSVVALLICDAILLVAAVSAYLVVEPNTIPGLNVSRFSLSERAKVADLRRRETTVWHRAALSTFAAIQRKGNDLYYSRCWLVWGLLVGVVGVLALAYASGATAHPVQAFPNVRHPSR